MEMNKMRCLVLGGKGFIGSHLVDALLADGHFVRAFDRPNVISLSKKIVASNYEEIEGDFASEADISAAVVGCDICFHLVSTTLPKSSNADPVFDIETNLMGTVRLLNHAVENGIKKIIFLSSGGTVYGRPLYTPINEAHPKNPICSYGITKLTIEKYLGLYEQLHGLEYTVLRLSNPFGPRQRIHASQGAVAVFLGKALRGETLEIWGDGSVVRDYIYISDVIQSILRSIECTGNERVFNIGSGKGLSLNEVLDGIEVVIGKKTDRRYTSPRDFDVPVSILSIDRALSKLDWSPQKAFLDGLRHTAEWMKNNLQA